MNTIEFKIHYHYHSCCPRDNPYAADQSEWSPYYRLLHRFLLQHDGTFSLCLGDKKLELGLDPDLLTVFEELPDVLSKIKSTKEKAYLDFFEQGTDLVIILIPQGQDLKIGFDLGSTASSEFRILVNASYLVKLSQFVNEWVRFLNEILAAILIKGKEEEKALCLQYRALLGS